MTAQEAMRRASNLVILRALMDYLDKHPDARFGQALLNLGILEDGADETGVEIKDPFYEEPWETLDRMGKVC